MKKRKIRKPIEVPGSLKIQFKDKNTLVITVKMEHSVHSRTMLGLAEMAQKERENEEA